MPPEAGRSTDEVTYLEAIRQALWEEMERDEAVFCLGEDIGAYGGAFQITKGFVERFGEARTLDTPISESCIVGVATGAALIGFRPVAEMQFGDFIACGFDQVVNQAATLRYRYGGRQTVPIVIRCPCGAGVHGGLYHSQQPEAWFVHRPGLKVVAPATPYDAKGLLKAAIRDDNPVLYFEHKGLYRRIKGPVGDAETVVPLGVADIKRPGDALTVVTYGAMVHPCLEAAARLADAESVEAEVLDLRTLAPLDREAILTSVRKTSKVAIVHEASRTCGVGAEVAAFVAEEAFEDLDGPIVRVTTPDVHLAPFSPPLEEYVLPNTEKIFAALRKLAAY
ncbi:MAG TPA: alpha-ketoacid dehydrogenase subunit beta [Methylomirabilota bacterium]|jgi:2-oxoisovalerate dehydrogenase E1 component beta subunit|nr:alpha-ketoacid dehydrogenase subunit beta [Methylomirabilota bacterium]